MHLHIKYNGFKLWSASALIYGRNIKDFEVRFTTTNLTASTIFSRVFAQYKGLQHNCSHNLKSWSKFSCKIISTKM